MPPLPRINSPALAALTADLRRSPRRVLLEQIDRAESLAADVDPDQSYPVAFLLFRLTGYRAGGGDSDATADRSVLPGDAVLADLSAMVASLCAASRLTDADLPAESLSRDELAARWSVSRRTIDRATRRGLIARRIDAGSHSRLVFSPAAIAAYERRASGALERAGSFRRLDPAERDRMLRRARRYRARFGASLNAVAVRLARRFGRSQEGVRDLLLRHDAAERRRAEGRPIFPPPRARDRAVRFRIWRAARDGVEPAELGAGIDADARAAQRLAGGLRLALLHRLPLAGPAAPVFERSDAAEVLLGPDAVRTDLEIPPAAAPLADQLARARALGSEPAGSADAERAMVTALGFLRFRARAARDGFGPGTPPASALDRVETDLRWAVLLRTRLVAGRFGTVVRTIEDVTGPLDALGDREVRRLVRIGLLAAATAAEQHPAWRGGRLAAAVTIAVARAVPRQRAKGDAAAGRAARQLPADAAGVDIARDAVRLTESVLLGVDPRVRTAWHAGVDKGDPWIALGRRMGWDGADPPLTLDELAEATGTTRMWAARRARAAVRTAIASRDRLGSEIGSRTGSGPGA